jgi:hypothetical protein
VTVEDRPLPLAARALIECWRRRGLGFSGNGSRMGSTVAARRGGVLAAGRRRVPVWKGLGFCGRGSYSRIVSMLVSVIDLCLLL